jgi:hypothetical protein
MKTETEFSLRNVVFCKINRTVFLGKDRKLDNVQKRHICTNVPLSQTFTSYSIAVMRCCEFSLPNVAIAQLTLQLLIVEVGGWILRLEVVHPNLCVCSFSFRKILGWFLRRT